MCRYHSRSRVLRVGYLHLAHSPLIVRPTLVCPDIAIWHHLETNTITTFAHILLLQDSP